MRILIYALIISLFSAVTVRAVAFSPTPKVTEPEQRISVDYTLPYPGLLPDHPLYFLKALRDKILDTFISEGTKRVEFHLLMADKRLAMGERLMEKGEHTLAISTVLKGEKYLERAITEFEKVWAVSPEGTEVLLERIGRSVLKHKEVISVLRAKVIENQKQWQEIDNLSQRNLSRVGKIK